MRFLDLPDQCIRLVLGKLKTRHFVKFVSANKRCLYDKYRTEFSLRPVLKHTPAPAWIAEHAANLATLTYVRIREPAFSVPLDVAPRLESLQFWLCKIPLSMLHRLTLVHLKCLKVHRLIPGPSRRLPPHFFETNFPALTKLVVTCHSRFTVVSLKVPPCMEYLDFRAVSRMHLMGPMPPSLKKLRLVCCSELTHTHPFTPSLQVLSLTIRQGRAPMETLFPGQVVYDKLQGLHVNAQGWMPVGTELARMPKLSTLVVCASWIHIDRSFADKLFARVELHARHMLDLGDAAKAAIRASGRHRVTCQGMLCQIV